MNTVSRFMERRHLIAYVQGDSAHGVHKGDLDSGLPEREPQEELVEPSCTYPRPTIHCGVQSASY